MHSGGASLKILHIYILHGFNIQKVLQMDTRLYEMIVMNKITDGCTCRTKPTCLFARFVSFSPLKLGYPFILNALHMHRAIRYWGSHIRFLDLLTASTRSTSCFCEALFSAAVSSKSQIQAPNLATLRRAKRAKGVYDAHVIRSSLAYATFFVKKV